ncbi:hypothetical protein [Aeromonas phage 50AhydR13PP]|uniref:Uncharacterized protein n=1 Tax=Aeromonas phage 50AhydR13PP TaxID=2163978 RepID=A0A2S1PEK4_9CAUD|nr:hypothetical protein KNT90_gp245 [Aeromonas phage 50AhydR13PP]AWH14992.1 hypothetical protein [Aeromonas phage 50AhydR13PP]
MLGRTLVIQIVAPWNLRNHTSNVTRYGRKMTVHYNFFTAKSGAPRWIRTIDPPVKSRMLYQLS